MQMTNHLSLLITFILAPCLVSVYCIQTLELIALVQKDVINEWYHLCSGAALALLDNNHLLEKFGYNVEITFEDSGCNVIRSLGTASEFLHDHKMDGIIGPTCSSGCVTLGYLATFMNLPMISFGCSSALLSDKTVYPTFARTRPFARAMANVLADTINNAMKSYEWDNMAIVYSSDSAWIEAYQHVLEVLEKRNDMHIDPKISIEEMSSETEAMEILKKRTRIILFLCYDENAARLLTIAYKLGMYNGDYAFFTFDFHAHDKWKTTTWYKTDEIYNGLMNLGVKKGSHALGLDEFQKFSSNLTKYMEKKYSYSANKYYEGAGYIYDAVKGYILAVKKTFENGYNETLVRYLKETNIGKFLELNGLTEDKLNLIHANKSHYQGRRWIFPSTWNMTNNTAPKIDYDLVKERMNTSVLSRDGKRIIQNLFRSHFHGKSGEVNIGAYGDRFPVLVVENFQKKETGIGTVPIFEFDTYSKNFLPYTNNVIWPGGSLIPPKDMPHCGFNHQLCPEKKEGMSSSFLMLILLAPLAGVVAMFFGVRAYRLSKYEKDLLNQDMIFQFEDLDIPALRMKTMYSKFDATYQSVTAEAAKIKEEAKISKILETSPKGNSKELSDNNCKAEQPVCEEQYKNTTKIMGTKSSENLFHDKSSNEKTLHKISRNDLLAVEEDTKEEGNLHHVMTDNENSFFIECVDRNQNVNSQNGISNVDNKFLEPKKQSSNETIITVSPNNKIISSDSDEQHSLECENSEPQDIGKLYNNSTQDDNFFNIATVENDGENHKSPDHEHFTERNLLDNETPAEDTKDNSYTDQESNAISNSRFRKEFIENIQNSDTKTEADISDHNDAVIIDNQNFDDKEGSFTLNSDFPRNTPNNYDRKMSNGIITSNMENTNILSAGNIGVTGTPGTGNIDMAGSSKTGNTLITDPPNSEINKLPDRQNHSHNTTPEMSNSPVTHPHSRNKTTMEATHENTMSAKTPTERHSAMQEYSNKELAMQSPMSRGDIEKLLSTPDKKHLHIYPQILSTSDEHIVTVSPMPSYKAKETVKHDNDSTKTNNTTKTKECINNFVQKEKEFKSTSKALADKEDNNNKFSRSNSKDTGKRASVSFHTSIQSSPVGSTSSGKHLLPKNENTSRTTSVKKSKKVSVVHNILDGIGIFNPVNFTRTFRAKLKDEQVFVKQIPKTMVTIDRDMKVELKQVRDLQHVNLNPYYGVCSGPPFVLFASQICKKGSLFDVLQNEDFQLENNFRYAFMFDIAQGLMAIHDSPIKYHGHLTSRNVLIDSRWSCKISDYGLREFRTCLSRVNDGDLDEKYEPFLWTAPENININFPKMTKEGDIYSYGIILSEIINREPPYSTYSDYKPRDFVHFVAKRCIPPFRPHVCLQTGLDGRVLDIMRSCWDEFPENRPTIQEVKTQVRNVMKKSSDGVNLLDNMIDMMEKYAQELENNLRQVQREKQMEKEKLDKLLLSELPGTVAEKLKMGQPAPPMKFKEASVLLLKVHGFSKYVDRLKPQQCVDVLHDLQKLVNQSKDKNVHELTACRDQHVFVCGAPEKMDKKHAYYVAKTALKIMGGIATFRFRHIRQDGPLKLKMVLHSGGFMAGLVGLGVPSFALLGKAIEHAESVLMSIQPNRIFVTEECKSNLEIVKGTEWQNSGPIHLVGYQSITQIEGRYLLSIKGVNVKLKLIQPSQTNNQAENSVFLNPENSSKT